MRTGPGIALMLLGLMTTVAAAAPFEHRLVVVVGELNDQHAAKQHEMLARYAAALRERDVVVQDITPEVAGQSRPELGVRPGVPFKITPTSPTTADVTGDLTLHGITHPLTLKATFTKGAVFAMTQKYMIGFQVTGDVKRSDFGVSKYVAYGLADDVRLTISAPFERTGN